MVCTPAGLIMSRSRPQILARRVRERGAPGQLGGLVDEVEHGGEGDLPLEALEAHQLGQVAPFHLGDAGSHSLR